MNPKIVFLHIPKCAGTSLRHAIDEALTGSGSDSGDTVRIETRPSFTAAQILGVEVQDFRERLLLYFMSDPSYQFISGHISFSDTAFRHYAGEWDFVTLLRHPVSRWLSHYYFNRSNQNSHTRITVDLEEFLLSERARELGSEYVRRLSQCSNKSVVSSHAAISLAKKNLARLSLVGTIEKLDLFCDSFMDRFGIRLKLQRCNRNPAPSEIQEALEDKDIVRRVEKLCRPDMQVYRMVQRNMT
jgi:hypothetical protein